MERKRGHGGSAEFPAESRSVPKDMTERQKHIVSRFSFPNGHVLTRTKTLSSRKDERSEESEVSNSNNKVRLLKHIYMLYTLYAIIPFML